VECGFFFWPPLEVLLVELGGCKGCQRSDVFLKTPDEFFHPLDGPKELLYALGGARGRTIKYLRHLVVVCLNAVAQYPMTKELN
jgi:hypothetical protein